MKQLLQNEQLRFNGSDYKPELDNLRLSYQLRKIFELMKDGNCRTLKQIEQLTNFPQASISAQLRHLRKPRFGSHQVEKIRINDPEKGLFTYKLIVNT